MTIPKKFLILGEALIELSHLNENTLHLDFAGDTLNTTFYLTRLLKDKDVNFHYGTGIGDDPYSDKMLSHLKAEGIYTELMLRLEKQLPGLYLIRTDESGERTFYFYRTASAARVLFMSEQFNFLLDRMDEMNYIYLSAIGLAIMSKKNREYLWVALAKAKKKGTIILFDTNYRAALWNSVEEAQEAIKQTASHVTQIFPTFGDEQLVFGDKNPEKSIERYISYGIEEIIVKCGGQPCWVWSNNQVHKVESIQGVEVLDTTGAGDAFNAGYLAARFRNFSPIEAAQYGHLLAAKVIGVRGAIIPINQMPSLF